MRSYAAVVTTPEPVSRLESEPLNETPKPEFPATLRIRGSPMSSTNKIAVGASAIGLTPTKLRQTSNKGRDVYTSFIHSFIGQEPKAGE